MLDQLIIGSLLKRAFVLVPLHILPSPVLYVQARIDLGSKQRAWLSPSLTAARRRRGDGDDGGLIQATEGAAALAKAVLSP